MVNLDHNASFTAFDPVLPGGIGLYEGRFPSNLVNPDRTMYAPRFGFAYSPKFAKFANGMVLRGGYSIMYNTGQFATFARSLSHQPPFATTQSNDVVTPTVANPTPTATGCTTTQSAYTFVSASGAPVTRPATTANVTLAPASNGTSGFNCSTANAIQNNWAVDKNYRLGMVQIYNLNLQKRLRLA
jgi:hypothetical protein